MFILILILGCYESVDVVEDGFVNTDADAHPDTDTDADAHPDTDTDTDAHPDTDTDTDAHPDTDTDTDADAHPDTDTDTGLPACASVGGSPEGWGVLGADANYSNSFQFEIELRGCAWEMAVSCDTASVVPSLNGTEVDTNALVFVKLTIIPVESNRTNCTVSSQTGIGIHMMSFRVDS